MKNKAIDIENDPIICPEIEGWIYHPVESFGDYIIPNTVGKLNNVIFAWDYVRNKRVKPFSRLKPSRNVTYSSFK